MNYEGDDGGRLEKIRSVWSKKFSMAEMRG